MSIQSQITRITTARDRSFQALSSKGISVPAGPTIDDLPSVIESISTKSAATIVPSTTDYTIASGYFLTGAQTIKGDPNLIPGNIVAGTSIFGVTGTGEGGGGGGVEEKQIMFIDYDGTLLYSYDKTDIVAMTSESELPANPSHTGLTAQGWNWTLAQIKAQLTALPDGVVYVGQMYTTSSGKTEIDVTLHDSAALSPYLCFRINGSATIEWGDGATSSVTGNSFTISKNTQHTYSAIGDYTIKISVVTGSIVLQPLYSGQSILSANTSSSNTTRYSNVKYANCITAIRIGPSADIGDNFLNYCYSIKTITIPKTITTVATYAFAYCYALTGVVIPNSVTTLGNYTCSSCRALVRVSFPYNVTDIGNNVFYACYKLKSFTIPNKVTTIGTNLSSSCSNLVDLQFPSSITSLGSNAFQSCDNLEDFSFPGTVSIPNNAFNNCYSLKSYTIGSGVTSIGSSAFNNCYSLISLTIPATVESIGNNAFAGCYGMLEYHFLSTTVPSIGTSVFNYIQSGCVIYVPSAKLNDYKTASNWANYASYIQGE